MTEIPSMFLASTYDTDFPLFAELGLSPFEKLDHMKEHHVGSAMVSDRKVEIYVTPAPAQFWKFKIEKCLEGESCEITTGSGALSDYWPSVIVVCNSCFTVKYQ